MNLYICYTPLHSVICQSINKLESEDHKVIYITHNDTKQTRYYYKEISKNSESKYIVLGKSFFENLNQLKNIISIIDGSVNKIFVGNVKHFYSRFIYFLIKKHNPQVSLFTFDDGSGHISGDGYFYSDKENSLSNFIFSFLDRKLLYKNIHREISKHITIYKSKNWADTKGIPKTFIDLYIDTDNEKSKVKIIDDKSIHIVYLGNSFYMDGELSYEKNLELEQWVTNEFDIDTFIPHPRDSNVTNPYLSSVKYIGNKIGEEVIIELSSQYDSVKVVGCYSSVLLNVIAIENVDIVNIPVKLSKPTNAIEKIIMENGGINADYL
tara:strand:+ start:8847 stop:9815 length:969 start_codon:yes stop_codon:yes gene_type:complete